MSRPTPVAVLALTAANACRALADTMHACASPVERVSACACILRVSDREIAAVAMARFLSTPGPDLPVLPGASPITEAIHLLRRGGATVTHCEAWAEALDTWAREQGSDAQPEAEEPWCIVDAGDASLYLRTRAALITGWSLDVKPLGAACRALAGSSPDIPAAREG